MYILKLCRWGRKYLEHFRRNEEEEAREEEN